MKILRYVSGIVTVFALALMVAAPATFAAADNAGQCPGYNDPANTKVDTSDGSIVLEAGLTVCFKAGNGNTYDEVGYIVTDGETSIAEYIEASGLLNEGGQVPNISNYVVYPSTPPSENPSNPPSENPSTPPSENPSTPPSVAPSTPVTPSESAPDTGGSAPTPPPTDTAPAGFGGTPTSWAPIVALLAGTVFLGTLLLAPRPKRK